MQPTGRAGGSDKLVSGLVRFAVTVVVVGLLGLVGFLASERNARTFTFAVDGDRLVVMKGRRLPAGAEPWTPEDPAQAEAYAPIPLHGFVPSSTFLEQSFQERDELDRALFEHLERQARPRISSDDPQKQERGVYYLRRAALLSGISRQQRETLAALQSEVAWYQAKLKLEQARQLIVEAMGQLELAGSAQDPNAVRARELAQRLLAPTRQLDETLRRGLGGTGVETVPPPARLEGEVDAGVPPGAEGEAADDAGLSR
jgi:hypothetical protein